MCGVKNVLLVFINLRERYRKKGQEKMKSIGGRYLDGYRGRKALDSLTLRLSLVAFAILRFT